MSLEFIKFAFIAGELSKTFYGRSDLEKFDLGLAEATNWFVDYRGGLSTRPGTIFCEYVKDDDQPVRIFPFRFSTEVANTYILLFGHNYLRFLQDGSYVVEDAKTITGITKANPGVVTSASHGYSDGDWLKLEVAGMSELNSRTVIVANKTANTFELHDPFGNNINTSGYGTFTSGSAYRVYTVSTPYAATDLEGISLYQRQDLVRVTHSSFVPYDLQRVDHTDWTLLPSEFGSTAGRPTGLDHDPSDTGEAETGYAVTSVNYDGDESQQSSMEIANSIRDFTTTAGSVVLSWTPVADADYYNVYRTIVSPDTDFGINQGSQLGYIGRTKGASFVDNNIIPDFSRSPPLNYNPFAPGRIKNISVNSQGSGYSNTATVSISDPDGSGFIGFPVISEDGNCVGIVIINGGTGYTNPSVSVSGGFGATFSVTVEELEGTTPALSCVFQQRWVYAASVNQPLTLWGSRVRRYSNFDVSDIVSDSDSYEFDIDSDESTPIKHLIPMRGGLLVMTNNGVWQLTGGGQGNAVTPTNALADPHTYTGVSDAIPVRFDTDLLYVESKGYTVRLLSYNDFSRVYSGEDVSILSNHLFNAERYITQWAFASDPYKIVWARRSDGALLGFTLVKEQKVFAWTKHFTKGMFEDVLAIQEDRTDAVYFIVKRFINGRWTKFIERFAPREAAYVEDAHCVDCGLAVSGTTPAAGVQASAATGVAALVADAAVFSAGDVGKIWRGGGGKGVVTAYTDSTHITVNLARPITKVLQEDEAQTPLPLESGEWTLDAPFTSVSGLWHLEGQSVQVLADGNVVPNKTVTNGTIALGREATRCVTGLGFTSIARTLPVTLDQGIVEGRRKRLTGLVMRMNETRGLKIGETLEQLYEFRERANELWGEPTELQDGMKSIRFRSSFSDDAQLYFVQSNPLPGTILGYVAGADIGDDPE